MKDDLISRQVAIEALTKANLQKHMDSVQDGGQINRSAIRIIMELPTADVVERKKGKWIRITQGAVPEQYMCPFCHRTVEAYGVEELLPIRYPYCHCGSDMRGEEE